MKVLLIFSFFGLIVLTNLQATTIHVPSQQTTIQAGIGAAIDGDTVLVQPGGYGLVDFIGKNIVVGSLFLTTNDTSYIPNTVIYHAVYFSNGEDSTAVLTGFTINNHGYDSGIYCSGSGPTLRNLIVRENWTYSHGGGISCENSSSPNLMNVTISENWSKLAGGGGIFCRDSRMSLVNVTISDNFHGMDSIPTTIPGGGGILCFNSELRMINVTISGNSSTSSGGGIYSRESNLSFDPDNRCNIYLNTAIEFGNDLYNQSGNIISVVVDTFTVMNPDNSHAYPLNKFTFDIRNAVVTNLSEYSNLPTKFSLNQNYPNPFNPTTVIKFDLPKASEVTLKIINILGEEVTTLVSERLSAGRYTYNWDAGNLASGVYLYWLKAGEFLETKKMMLIR